MVHFGIVGAGRMGNTHASQIKLMKDACVSMVYDIVPEHAENLAGTCGAKVCASLAELVNSPEVDCVLVCTPTYIHQEAVYAAMDAKKPIFCEKPLCRTKDLAVEMLSRIEKYDQFFMPGFVRRLLGKSKKVKKILESGMLGKLLYCNVDLPVGGYHRQRGDWFTDFDLCGGVVIDMLAHHVDLANWYFGKAQRVYADGLLLNKNLPLPADYVASVVTYESGVICNMSCSWQRFGRSGEMMEIYGEKGAVIMDGTDVLTVCPIDGAKYTIDGNADTQPASFGKGVEEVNVGSGFFCEMRAVIDSLNGKKIEVPTVRDAWNSVAVGFAMIESIKTGKAVEL